MRNKIVTVIGIRPDIIRLSLILEELDKYFLQTTVDTGQHWDFNLNKVMYQQLGVKEPTYRLELTERDDTQIKQIGRISANFEEVLKKEKPSFVVILGDNNSSLATALTCANLNIPIAHIESGGRSFNWKMPEEKNRTVIDHLSDILFAYTDEHKLNLIREGIDPRRIWVVGNPIVDVLNKNLGRRKATKMDELKLDPASYVLVTLHRAENVQDKGVLSSILEQLSQVGEHYNKRIILIEMPKLANAMKSLNYPKNIETIEPQPYLEFLELEKFAQLVISDSGTVPEVVYSMGKPCIQIREKTERIELIENGSTILLDCNSDIVNAASCLLERQIPRDSTPYKVDVAQKITSILLSNWWSK